MLLSAAGIQLNLLEEHRGELQDCWCYCKWDIRKSMVKGTAGNDLTDELLCHYQKENMVPGKPLF